MEFKNVLHVTNMLFLWGAWGGVLWESSFGWMLYYKCHKYVFLLWGIRGALQDCDLWDGLFWKTFFLQMSQIYGLFGCWLGVLRECSFERMLYCRCYKHVFFDNCEWLFSNTKKLFCITYFVASIRTLKKSYFKFLLEI